MALSIGWRAARLLGHAKEVARKARDLEAALVDKRPMTIAAFDASDKRTFAVAVAGPTTLLVSKSAKIPERVAERKQSRLDALLLIWTDPPLLTGTDPRLKRLGCLAVDFGGAKPSFGLPLLRYGGVNPLKKLCFRHES